MMQEMLLEVTMKLSIYLHYNQVVSCQLSVLPIPVLNDRCEIQLYANCDKS